MLPDGSRQNSIVSAGAVMSARSRAGSSVSTRRSPRAGSRQESVSGGVVGLPGAFDEFIDPHFSDANTTLFDPFLDLDTADISVDNLNANQFENNNISQYFCDQEIQSGLGLVPSLGQDEQEGLVDHTVVSDKTQIGTSKDPSNLMLKVSTHDVAYEPADSHPDFSAWNDHSLQTIQPLDTTPGLSAIPGGNSFASQLPITQQYPDPFALGFPTEPYFNPQIEQFNEYILTDPLLQKQQGDVPQQSVHVGHTASRQFILEDDEFIPKPKRKRNRIQSDSESDSDVPIIKRHRQGRPVKQKHVSESSSARRDSTFSDHSSLSQPVNVPVVRAGEKPKKCDDKSWVRINNSTKGASTRTARINQFIEDGNKYKIKPLPIGDWETDKFKFEYNQNSGMDEFKKRTMSSRQIHEYITEYPEDYLRIWIQVTPGDAARRYASKSHSECLFEQCPNRVWAHKGTIEVGNYRVAFDEKHKRYGKGVVDPFDCVGYAHLYCMERFLDFAGICEIADVKVDTRGDMTKEPKTEASFIFNKKHAPERMLAEKFIKAAKLGQLGRTPEFSNYPVHTDFKKGRPKPHEKTLVSAMFNINWEHRPRSQLKQFVTRNILPTSFGVHRGDQEIIVVDKKVEAMKVYKKAKEAYQHEYFDHSAYYSHFHPEIDVRIAECLALRARFQAEDAQGPVSARRSRKRKMVSIDESDDERPEFTRNGDYVEEIGTEYQHQQPIAFSRGSRSGRRKKQRTDTTGTHNMLQGGNIVYSQVPGYAPASNGSVSQHQGGYGESFQSNSSYMQHNSGSPKSRKSSFSAIFKEVEDAPAVRRLTDKELDFMMSLPRRKSSTMSIGPYNSIMKSPKTCYSSRSPQTARTSLRTASFNAQPVTSSKEYNINDPPSHVTGLSNGTNTVYNEDYHQGRRSARLASKTPSPVERVAVDQISKFHRK